VATRLPAAARRRQLLDVALTVFATRGFHATSMNDVADAAGVTKPVLYQHFPSKRSLYHETLTEVGERLRRAIEAATAEAATPSEQVFAGVRAYLRFVAADRAAFTLLFGSGARRDEEFARTASAVGTAVAESVSALLGFAGVDATERDVLGHAVVGLTEGACRHWIEQGCVADPDELAETVAGLAWAGLRGVGEPS
jgi:AcrR family transcriptional regulator